MSESDDELRARAEARVGTILREKYTIERVIGIGGMASVYAASHRNGRRVALKLLHPELSIRADLRKRFLREAQAANAVNHPGVVAVLDDDVTEDGAAFLVMELLDGQSVEELWEAHGQRLSAKTVLTLASDLCAVLTVAHAAGVVHRDLKPANLFVTRTGELKVLDFGIARVRDAASTSATSTGSVFGTPAFMAPEQAGGLMTEVGPLTDVWAVGATMYTLLSGRPVHDGQSGQHIAILAATRPAPSLGLVLPDAPLELVAIVDRALAFDKAERWGSAEALRSAVIEAMTALAERAAPLGAGLSETMIAIVGVRPLEEGSETLVKHPITPRIGTLASPGNNAAFLGGTTGQPVSSEAVTRVKAERHRDRGAVWARGTAAFQRWFQRDHALAADASKRAPTRTAPRWPFVGAAAVAAVSALAMVGASFRATQRAVPSAPHSVPSAAVPVPSASVFPVAPTPSTAPPETTAVSEPVPLAASVSAAVTTPDPSRMTPSVNARTKGLVARPRPGPTAVMKVNCNPPFTLVDGIQIHKAACP